VGTDQVRQPAESNGIKLLQYYGLCTNGRINDIATEKFIHSSHVSLYRRWPSNKISNKGYRVLDFIVLFRTGLYITHEILEFNLIKNLVDFIDFMTPVSLVNFMDLLTHRYHRLHDSSQSIYFSYLPCSRFHSSIS